jgi:pentatricopeptide repeat protein
MLSLRNSVPLLSSSRFPSISVRYCSQAKREYAEAETSHSLNHKLGRAVRIHDYPKALEILHQIRENEYIIEPAQYDMVLKLYCDEEMLKGADRFLSRMDFPSVVQANAVLHAHCKAGDVQGAISFFKKMKSLGIKHDEQSYLEIIRAVGKDYHKVLEMLFRMEQENLVPNLAIYTDVLYCLAVNHKYKEAIKVYREMQKSGIRPEAIVYNLVLEIATLAKDKELMNELVVAMWEANVAINPHLFEPIRLLEEEGINGRHEARE